MNRAITHEKSWAPISNPSIADHRTIVITEPVLFSELRALIKRLPATSARGADGTRHDRRLFHVMLENLPAGGHLISQFAVLGDSDYDLPGSDTVLLLGDKAHGFRLGSARRVERKYASQDALENDLRRLAGEGQTVRLQLYKDLKLDHLDA